MTVLSGWGRYPLLETGIVTAEDVREASRIFAASEGIIARGNGRAYGDAAVGLKRTISTLRLNRFRSFNPRSGLLTVEAGVMLDDIISVFLCRGFFKVVPGTRYITVGGAIAADVHGKNHHRDGGFGEQLESFVLATSCGKILRCSREENADAFFATIGGMGLTGTILEATIRLIAVETGWIRQKTVIAPNLSVALQTFEANDDVTYSVAWIDCLAKGSHLGRSLVFFGEHAKLDDLDQSAKADLFPAVGRQPQSVPIEFPSFALNHLTVAAFNRLYYSLGARKAGGSFLVAANPYFFPLDGVHNWNRIYGRRGFVQHQCVLPLESAQPALIELLRAIASKGDASFLAVLKKMGPGHGLMSFPMKGYTLALDFPMRPGLLSFLDEIDKIVVAAGGRLYLAKDARQSRATFVAGYQNLRHFQDVCRRLDPKSQIRSHLADRLGIK